MKIILLGILAVLGLAMLVAGLLAFVGSMWAVLKSGPRKSGPVTVTVFDPISWPTDPVASPNHWATYGGVGFSPSVPVKPEAFPEHYSIYLSPRDPQLSSIGPWRRDHLLGRNVADHVNPNPNPEAE